MNITQILSEQLNIDKKNIENVINLLDDGSTVAFIARYRKEKTGNLNDVDIRNIEKNLNKLRNIENRQEEIISSLKSQDKLSDELKERILSANSLTILEDIYAPYKKRRKTRADKAKDLWLEPLYKFLITDDNNQKNALEYD